MTAGRRANQRSHFLAGSDEEETRAKPEPRFTEPHEVELDRAFDGVAQPWQQRFGTRPAENPEIGIGDVALDPAIAPERERMRNERSAARLVGGGHALCSSRMRENQ